MRGGIKALAARQNARLRWSGGMQDGVIPVAALIDGAWYLGRGRTTSIALWDGHGGVFQTIGMNSYVDPKTFPSISRRATRLKQERHITEPGGTFEPVKVVAS